MTRRFGGTARDPLIPDASLDRGGARGILRIMAKIVRRLREGEVSDIEFPDFMSGPHGEYSYSFRFEAYGS